jgi:hypothetical protein
MTQVGSIPLGAGKGVLHGVGKVGGVVGGAVGGVFRRDKDKGDSAENGTATREPPSGQVSAPSGDTEASSGDGAGYLTTNTATAADEVYLPSDSGLLKVTVLRAKDLPAISGDTPKAYVVLRLGDKDHKTKHKKETNAPEWYVFPVYAN